jgi:hypothetical protein
MQLATSWRASTLTWARSAHSTVTLCAAVAVAEGLAVHYRQWQAAEAACDHAVAVAVGAALQGQLGQQP